jgi:hypothetical protein
MTHNIIKTENYLLVVDDSKIKQNDFYYGVADGSIKPFIEIADENTVEIVTWQLNVIGKSPNKKIAAHLPLNNSPVLEGVDLLPKLEEKYDFAEMFYGILKTTYPEFDEWVEAKEYNKAKEKYKYTEEDLRKAMAMYKGEFTKGIVYTQEQVIQSLQQPKMPVAFECEDDYVHDDTVPYPKTLGTHPKTVVNHQNQTVLVGKYIY